MKFLHFGDLHVWKLQLPPGELLYPKRWLGPANLLLRRAAKFPPEFRKPALEAVGAEQPDLAVFTGDFTQSSLPSEFREVDALFAPLRELLGDRLIALPGNHDVYTHRSRRRRILEQHLPWVQTEPVTRFDLTDRLTLVCVNHSEPFLLRSNGRVRPEAHALLREVLTGCRDESRSILLAGHYPFASPPEAPEPADHKLLGDARFAAAVREFEVALYLHGHQHHRWALRSPLAPKTLCLNCGSVSMRHPSPGRQAGFLTWTQLEDGRVEHLTAHTFDGASTWRKTPVTVRTL